MHCKNCQGDGYYYEGGYSFAWSDEQAEEFKHTCNECKGTGMEFKKYSSLTDSYNKNIPFAVEAAGKAMCEASEKMHGSNMSVHMCRDMELPVFGRRKGFLGEDESFNGSINLRSLVTLYMLSLFESAPSIIQSISVYGELYGGNGDGRKAVQTEIKYCEKLRFRAFDMFVSYIGEDGELKYEWADTVNMRGICKNAGFEVAEPVHTGTLTELLALDPEFNSLTSEYDEPAEGWVIRPIDTIRMRNGERVIIKCKSKAFEDKKPRVPKVKAELPANVVEALEETLPYLTYHRVASNMARDGIVDMMQMGEGMQSVMEDINKDMLEDGLILGNVLEKNERKMYNKRMTRAVAGLVKEYLMSD